MFNYCFIRNLLLSLSVKESLLLFKTTSIGDARLSVVGVIDIRYGVRQSGADAQR